MHTQLNLFDKIIPAWYIYLQSTDISIESPEVYHIVSTILHIDLAKIDHNILSAQFYNDFYYSATFPYLVVFGHKANICMGYITFNWIYPEYETAYLTFVSVLRLLLE